MADDNDDLLETVEAMADRLGLEGRERSKYVHEHMTRGGFKAVPQYVKAGDDDDDDDDGGSFFAGGSRRRSRDRDRDRDRGGRGGGRNRSRHDDDDWY